MNGCAHNDRYECNDCTDSRHAQAHPEPVEGCFACKVGTIQVSQQVKPKKAGAPPAGNRNNWERGIKTDHRGVPFLDGSGEPIGVKKYSESRQVFETERRRLANHPDPFGTKASL